MESYNIILVCEHGASTSMLTDRMKEAAKDLEIDVHINAYSYTKLDELIDGADLVLLGPQVRFKKKEFEKRFSDKGVEFVVVDTVDYGMMNGEKVLNDAMKILRDI